MHDAVKPCENGETRTDGIIGTTMEAGEINIATYFCVQCMTQQEHDSSGMLDGLCLLLFVFDGWLITADHFTVSVLDCEVAYPTSRQFRIRNL